MTYKRGESHPQARMTEAKAKDVKRLLGMGYEHKQISHMLGIGQSAVQHIAQGRTWRHLEDA